MSQKTLILYQSKTGFTQRYAMQIAQQTGAQLLELKKASAAALAGYDTILFGSRAHAGRIDGWPKAQKLLAAARRGGAARCALFVTGATPASERQTVEGFWAQNLTGAQQRDLPHFYLQSGLCYEKMPLIDRLMMKGLCAMLRAKKHKTGQDAAMLRMIARSFDASSNAFAAPVIDWVRAAAGPPPAA